MQHTLRHLRTTALFPNTTLFVSLCRRHQFGVYFEAGLPSRIARPFCDPPRRPAAAAADIDHLLPGNIGCSREQRCADRFDHALETVELGEPACARFPRPVVRGRFLAVPVSVVHCPSPTVAPIETCLEVGASGKSQPPPIALYNATSCTAVVACARAQAVSASCRRRSAASSSIPAISPAAKRASAWPPLRRAASSAV